MRLLSVRKTSFANEGQRYADVSAIQTAFADILRAMPANELKSSFEMLLSRANECIEAEEDNFE